MTADLLCSLMRKRQSIFSSCSFPFSLFIPRSRCPESPGSPHHTHTHNHTHSRIHTHTLAFFFTHCLSLLPSHIVTFVHIYFLICCFFFLSRHSSSPCHSSALVSPLTLIILLPSVVQPSNHVPLSPSFFSSQEIL